MEDRPTLQVREHRAKVEALAAAGLGVVVLVVGLWATFSGPPPQWTWLITLVILGPIIVFMAAIGYATYLENVEEDRYFHDDFRFGRADPPAH